MKTDSLMELFFYYLTMNMDDQTLTRHHTLWPKSLSGSKSFHWDKP
jgi:hypothetical protein